MIFLAWKNFSQKVHEYDNRLNENSNSSSLSESLSESSKNPDEMLKFSPKFY